MMAMEVSIVLKFDERAKTCVARTKCFKLKSSAPEPVYEEPETGYGPPDDGSVFISSHWKTFQLISNRRIQKVD